MNVVIASALTGWNVTWIVALVLVAAACVMFWFIGRSGL